MQKIIGIAFVLLLAFSCKNETKNPSNQNATATATEQKTTPVEDKKTILFFGNSLTAAFGLDPADGFVGVIQKKLDSLHLNYKTVNAGLSGETTAGGKERVDWVLRQNVAIFILELGGNDALRGIQPSESIVNLQTIIDKVKAKYPNAKIVLAGMLAPPNLGAKYSNEFKAMYPTLAKKNNLSLIPFLLEGVGGNPKLNLPDGIHPTIEGHKIVAKTIWSVLEKQL